eukprot:222679-Hanusia_phi.AAC.3
MYGRLVGSPRLPAAAAAAGRPRVKDSFRQPQFEIDLTCQNVKMSLRFNNLPTLPGSLPITVDGTGATLQCRKKRPENADDSDSVTKRPPPPRPGGGQTWLQVL